MSIQSETIIIDRLLRFLLQYSASCTAASVRKSKEKIETIIFLSIWHEHFDLMPKYFSVVPWHFGFRATELDRTGRQYIFEQWLGTIAKC